MSGKISFDNVLKDVMDWNESDLDGISSEEDVNTEYLLDHDVVSESDEGDNNSDEPSTSELTNKEIPNAVGAKKGHNYCWRKKDLIESISATNYISDSFWVGDQKFFFNFSNLMQVNFIREYFFLTGYIWNEVW